jgi:hypothetical protein
MDWHNPYDLLQDTLPAAYGKSQHDANHHHQHS